MKEARVYLNNMKYLAVSTARQLFHFIAHLFGNSKPFFDCVFPLLIADGGSSTGMEQDIYNLPQIKTIGFESGSEINPSVFSSL